MKNFKLNYYLITEKIQFSKLIMAIWIQYSSNLNHYLFLLILWLLRKSE